MADTRPHNHSLFVFGQSQVIDRTPPEVLNAIFKYHQSLNSPPNLSYEYRDTTLTSMNDIVTFSQVCRFWRNVSLSSPALWADINLHHRAANTFLKRSGDKPLRLYLLNSSPGPSTQDSQGTNLSSQDGKRVREIVLRVDNDCMEDVFDRLGDSFPELELALLHLEQEEADDVYQFNASTTVAPKLRVLRVSNIDLPNGALSSDRTLSGQLSGLTFLEISDTGPNIYSAGQIIRLIQRCPSLEFLHWDERNENSALEPLEEEDVVVTLDHLKGLYLRDYLFTELFFRQIRIPADAPLLSEVNPDEEKSLWGDAVLEIDYLNEVIKFGRGIHNDSRKPHLVAHLPGVPNEAAMASLIPMLGMILDFSKISKLTIKCRGEEDDRASTWRGLFLHFTALQSLRIIAGQVCSKNILTALWTTPTPCPDLDNLYLKCDPGVKELDWLKQHFDSRSNSSLPLLKYFVIEATPVYPKGDFSGWAEVVEMKTSLPERLDGELLHSHVYQPAWNDDDNCR